MKHDYVTIVYTWVAKCVESLKNRFIGGVPLKQTNITSRGTQSQQALDCRAAISERVVRAQLRSGYDAMERGRVERSIDDFAPKVLQEFGLGSQLSLLHCGLTVELSGARRRLSLAL